MLLPLIARAATTAQAQNDVVSTQSFSITALTELLSTLVPEQSVADRIKASARRNNVSESLALNIACVESQFNANAKNPHSTAGGVYQWLDGSWKHYSTKYWGNLATDKMDVSDNIELSIIVMRDVGTDDWTESKESGYGGGWSNHPYERGLCNAFL